MKKGLLVMLCLGLVGVGFAQTKSTKKKLKRTIKTTAASTPASTTTDTKVSASVLNLADTGKKVSLKPVIPMDLPVDGYYKSTNNVSAQPIAYAAVRQADIIFAKRVWREIDVREKLNQYMSAPQARLIDILVDAIKNDELRAFDANSTKEHPNGDDFAYPLTGKQAMQKLADSVLVPTIDKQTGETTGTKMRAGEFDPDSIVKFRIKEDWIFDKQRSVFEPRIVGIAPLIRIKVGEASLDYQPAFWIYFPEARPILASREVFARNNDASNLSYDQVFLKRYFSSYIVKESNVRDERIKDYAQGMDRLYESERIKKSLLDWELNLWQY